MTDEQKQKLKGPKRILSKILYRKKLDNKNKK